MRQLDREYLPGAEPVLGRLAWAAAMLPLAALTAGLWLSPAQWSAAWIAWIVDWCGAMLAFIAGVQRGLGARSYREREIQVGIAVWLYLLALLALISPYSRWRVGFLLAGFASLATLDLLVWRQTEAPLFFLRLRPLQMLVPLACVAGVEVWLWQH